MITPRIIDHLKLRHITYRNVFQGDVNHRKEFFGRLEKKVEIERMISIEQTH